MKALHTIRQFIEENFILAALLLLILFFGLTTDYFFSVVT